jgi:hypothetical protein
MKQLEERTMKKVFRRLVPFLMVCSLLSGQ